MVNERGAEVFTVSKKAPLLAVRDTPVQKKQVRKAGKSTLNILKLILRVSV